jgi:hypothetical protein
VDKFCLKTGLEIFQYRAINIFKIKCVLNSSVSGRIKKGTSRSVLVHVLVEVARVGFLSVSVVEVVAIGGGVLAHVEVVAVVVVVGDEVRVSLVHFAHGLGARCARVRRVVAHLVARAPKHLDVPTTRKNR